MSKLTKLVFALLILTLIGFIPMRTENIIGTSSVLLSYKNESCNNLIKSLCKKHYTNDKFSITFPFETEQKIISVKYRRQINHSFFVSYAKYCVVSYQDLQSVTVKDECMELDSHE